MKVTKCITLQDLKEMERKEYETLNSLSSMKYEYKKEGKIELVNSLEEGERYQRGRWGMLMDMIEEMEDVDNE